MARDVELRVTGAAQLLAVGKALRESGDRDLRKQMYAAAQRSSKPIRAQMKVSAATNLPKAGGLNVWVASKLSTRVKVRLVGKNVGIHIRLRRPNPNAAGGQADLSAINRGRVRHPTYGHRPWVVDVHGTPAARWADRVLAGQVADKARKEFIKALTDIAARITRAG